MNPILVAYATKYGSTEEVAGVVASALRERGIDADLSPASDISSLDRYSAVVLGAALYNHKWHRDAMQFIARHRNALMRLPVAIFTLGPVNDTPEEFKSAREQIDGVLAHQSWLSPTTVAVFGGRFDPARLRFPGASRLLAKVPATDIVDPIAVANWSRSLPEALELGRVSID